MNIQWFVFSLNGNKANRPNDDDVWKLLKSPFHDFFEWLKFLEIDVPWSVFSLNENKANKSN